MANSNIRDYFCDKACCPNNDGNNCSTKSKFLRLIILGGGSYHKICHDFMSKMFVVWALLYQERLQYFRSFVMIIFEIQGPSTKNV